MMSALRGRLLVFGSMVLAPALAAAEDGTGCERFAWSVARERGAFAAVELLTLQSGSGFPTGGSAARLTLRPAADLVLPVTSEREAKANTFGGFVTIAAPIEPGTYQVTVSDDAWIDVSQDGRTTMKPDATSVKSDCPGVRKSARFTLGAGSATIQVSRVKSPQIEIGFFKAD